jgi:hypothetical protein
MVVGKHVQRRGSDTEVYKYFHTHGLRARLIGEPAAGYIAMPCHFRVIIEPTHIID